MDIQYLANGPNSSPRSVGEKLGDIVSVSDYGALGNGDANDSPAIARYIFRLRTGPGSASVSGAPQRVGSRRSPRGGKPAMGPWTETDAGLVSRR